MKTLLSLAQPNLAAVLGVFLVWLAIVIVLDRIGR
jgi:hypothetical protein